MTTEEVIDLLGTTVLSATFSDRGLKYLSLKPDQGSQNIDLDKAGKGEAGSFANQVYQETVKFLKSGKHDMPLDLSAFTAFQQEVFKAVGQVEPGTVVTYKDVAIGLGKPGGAQAVGSAITKNPVSYFLPTHRVLPQKGIGICRTGAGHLREKLLAREGHDLSQLRGNYVCTREKCIYLE